MTTVVRPIDPVACQVTPLHRRYWDLQWDWWLLVQVVAWPRLQQLLLQRLLLPRIPWQVPMLDFEAAWQRGSILALSMTPPPPPVGCPSLHQVCAMWPIRLW